MDLNSLYFPLLLKLSIFLPIHQALKDQGHLLDINTAFGEVAELSIALNQIGDGADFTALSGVPCLAK